MSYPKVLKNLLDGGPLSLASWLADPLSRDEARSLLPLVADRLRSAASSTAGRFHLHLAELIARYWSEQDIEAHYKNLYAPLKDGYERAMLELTVGQLLMARRRSGAWEHLDRGFILAANLLEAEDYFTVLKRHELLRQLPPVDNPGDAASLPSLLKEARVIARIKGRNARPGGQRPRHRDTVD